jgi:hypothetical protein
VWAESSSIFVLVWPQPSVTETVASRPIRLDFIGRGVIAQVPPELIEGAVLLTPIRCSAPRFLRVGGVLNRAIGFVLQGT